MKIKDILISNYPSRKQKLRNIAELSIVDFHLF